MKNGRLSITPAPSVLVDGASLFTEDIKFKIFKVKRFIHKKWLADIFRSMNITIFCEKGKISKADLDKADIVYTDTVEMSIGKFNRYLRSSKENIFASEERSIFFGSKAYVLEKAKSKEVIEMYQRKK